VVVYPGISYIGQVIDRMGRLISQLYKIDSSDWLILKVRVSIYN